MKRRRRWGRAGLILALLLMHLGLIDQVVHHARPLDLIPTPLPVLQVRLLEAPAPQAAADAPPAQAPARAAAPARTSRPRPPPASRPSAQPPSQPASRPASPPSPGSAPTSAPTARPAPSVAASAPPGPSAALTAEPQPDGATPGPASVGPAPGDAAGGPVTPAPLLYGRPLLEPARSGRLIYAVYYGDYPQGQSLAHAVLSWKEQAGSYELSSEARADGLTSVIYPGALAQNSRGRIGPDGLEPAYYSEVRGRRAERSIDIGARLAGAQVPDRHGLQDRLSILLQLSLLARTRPDQMAPGQTLSLPEINFSDVERVDYVSQGYVTLMTPAGPLHAIHLLRQRPDNPQEPRIELWLGYDQGMLPIRLRVTDEYGRVIDQILKELP